MPNKRDVLAALGGDDLLAFRDRSSRGRRVKDEAMDALVALFRALARRIE